ncbi:MAG: helix-turn-helix domain-containing protein [Oscillospiraceae bacterium]|nr:helix-turn-helix domain-containing protein [Oscillospiraceae bacterium]
MQYKTSEIMTVEELIELLQIGKSTAYQLLASGEIRAFRIGRKWKIEREAVYEYIRGKMHGKENPREN